MRLIHFDEGIQGLKQKGTNLLNIGDEDLAKMQQQSDF